MIGGITMSEKSDKLRAMLAKEKERRIKLNSLSRKGSSFYRHWERH